MAEKYSSPAENNPTPGDPQEFLNCLEVVGIVQALHAAAKERTDAEQESGAGIGNAGLLMEKRNFILEKADPAGDESMPCPYDQMLMVPRSSREDDILAGHNEKDESNTDDEEEEIVQSIQSLTFKIPRLSPVFEIYLPLPEGAVRWNDFVLEVDYVDGQQGRYLVNSVGIVPFPGSEAIDSSIVYEEGVADLFVVPEKFHDWTVPPLKPSVLKKAITRSRMKRQKLPS